MTINFPSTVDELRSALLQAGLSPEKVASMKKAELKEAMIQLSSEKLEFQLEEIAGDEDAPATLESAIGVRYASDGWHNYIMGLFRADEIMDGYPKVNGLRRIASVVLGDVIFSGPVQTFVTHGEKRSVVVNYEVHVEWKLDTPVGFGNLNFTPQVRKFGALADCNEEADNMFGRHPAATAESKSEGRALRKALALNIIAAEEMVTGAAGEAPRARATAQITGPLQSVINAKADALSLNVETVLKEWGSSKPLSELTMDEGRELFDFINKYQQNK